MGYRLKSLNIGDGIMQESACENYRCRSCGAKMISANFVNGLCIQIFVSHRAECGYYTGNPAERTDEVTCETCRYQSDGGICTCDSECRFQDVRTQAI